MYDVIRQQFPGAHITTAAPKSTPSGNDVVIGLVTDPESPPSKPVASRGSIQLTVTSATRTAALSTRFAKCLWADDLADYINNHPGHTWIVARSVRIGVGAADARRDAEENASYLVERFISQHRRRSGLPDTLTAAAMLPLPISDRFVQRFKRPYGDVWSEAILLDITPQYLAGLEQRQNRVVAIRQTRVQTTVASLLIVLVSILAAYLFVNTVTRSYFTGRLRTAAILGAMLALSAAAVIIITVA